MARFLTAKYLHRRSRMSNRTSNREFDERNRVKLIDMFLLVILNIESVVKQ